MYVIYPVLCVDIYVISLFVLMESKKPKKIAFFPLCRVPHSAKRALPSAVTMALSKAGKQRPNFPALPSARAMALGKDFFLKKRKNFFAECKSMTLGKEFSIKKEKILCRVPLRWHSAKRPSELTSVFFLPSADVTLGKGFTECPICGTRQRSLCRRVLYRVQ